MNRDIEREIQIIKDAQVFDTQWYLNVYSDVRKSGMCPIRHYLLHGAKEGRNPSSAFNTTSYLKRFPEVEEEHFNPLVHYVLHGEKEGRRKTLCLDLKDYTIAIKTPCPVNDKKEWGEWHFANSLAQSLTRKGLKCRIDCREEWYNPSPSTEINFVIRGVVEFIPPKHKLNLMWIICHPGEISQRELAKYDWIFIASDFWRSKCHPTVLNKSETLLQCTDGNRFFYNKNNVDRDYLFVANSRMIERDVVKKCKAEGIKLDIFGNYWESFVPKDWVKGLYVPNEELSKFYGKSQIVFNDHFSDMRDEGFVNNRTFDVLASGTPLIMDRVQKMPRDLERYCYFFDEKVPLKSVIRRVKKDIKDNPRKFYEASAFVLKYHTFDARAETIYDRLTSSFGKHI